MADRRLIDMATHVAVFTWVLERLAEVGLVTGETPPEKRTAQQALYGNRRRIRGDRGRRLQRRRGELVERPFAHQYETGGLRRVWVRGHENVRKRVLIQAAGCNLGLLLRYLTGVGTPRSLQGRSSFGAFGSDLASDRALGASDAPPGRANGHPPTRRLNRSSQHCLRGPSSANGLSSTGCLGAVPRPATTKELSS